MAEIHSKSRQRAETAFGKAQSQLPTRGRAAEELDARALASAEKTLRLREARLARDTTAAELVAKRAK